jgi:hypothetical protein
MEKTLSPAETLTSVLSQHGLHVAATGLNPESLAWLASPASALLSANLTEVISSLVECLESQMPPAHLMRVRRNFQIALTHQPDCDGLRLLVSGLEQKIEESNPHRVPPGCGPLL